MRECQRLVGLIVMLLSLRTATAAVVRIERDPGTACGGTLIVHGHDGQEELSRTWTLDRDATRIELPKGAEWSLTLTEPARCWAPTLIVADDAEGAVWRLMPAGEVSGKLATAEGDSLPSSVSLRFEVPAVKHQKTVAIVPCPVAREGTWSCRVPAGELDLRIGSDGFAPVYAWGIRVVADTPAALGVMRLSRGASVSGWVTAGRQPVDPASAEIHLEPLGAPNDAADAPGAMQTRPNRRGFFQFTNVPAGMYVLSAGGDRLASSQRPTVKVAEEREVTLEPALELLPFARAEIRVTPPLDPRGQPWRVSLQRRLPASTYLAEPVRGTMVEEGLWTANDLRPGAYVLRITDGNSVEERREVEVAPEMPPLFIAMAVVPVKGRASSGSRGIEGTVELSSLTGGKAELATDEEGRFEGYLPAEGKWNIRLKLARGNQTIRARSVDVRRRDGESHARVDVELPGGVIRGKVTDEQGRPAPALVHVLHDGLPRTSVTADDSGEFELIGLDEGAAMLEARHAKKETGLVPVSVSRSTAPVTLVLKRQVTVEGWVSTPSGHPIGGAAVRLFGPQLSNVRETVTSPGGRFTMPLPGSVSSVGMAVVAPGLPAVVTTVPVVEDERVDVVVPGSGGRLLLRGLTSRRPWLAHEQTIVSLGLLFQPSYGGQSPNLMSEGIELLLAPGQYLLCPTRAISDRCTRHWVSAGARVVVDFSSSESMASGGSR
ncbi:MAG TPA: carboxypeptidase-like regulatory domain-containing protein [Thermoanaerobaculia bacterium]|nr:carboxypeptidase-like regulatory domain-containing protein [Thermoanaerobaculia bacterium]